MKSIKYILFAVVIVLSGCTRKEEVLEPARFPTTADIFTDNFVNLGSDFYFPYAEAKPDVFSVDESVGFESFSSIRIDVPNSNDPGGSFAGAIFRIDGPGRDLRDYNALTFWARSSQSANVAELGFGQNFLGDTYRALLTDIDLTTNWQQIIIPIPDPSKLLEERGVFQFAAGGIGEEGQEVGYTIWFDEMRFENLGTVAQPLARIFNGEDRTVDTFDDVTIPVTETSVLYSVDGAEVSVAAAPAYFDFSSSDELVASVDEQGNIMVKAAGTATITASVSGTQASGSLRITSSGPFNGAPVPPARNENDVVSVFSDAYANVQVDNYNGFFQFQTTQGGAISIAGDNIISYTQLNFVSINMFNSPDVNASQMTHMHLDVNVREQVNPGDFLRLELINNNGTPSQSSGSVQLTDYSALLEDQWVSYDIPLSDFTAAGLGGTNDIDLIFFISDGTVSSIYVDNVYFYR